MHDNAKKKALNNLVKFARELMGDKIKSGKPQAMEIEISTVAPIDEDDKEGRKKRLKEALGV